MAEESVIKESPTDYFESRAHTEVKVINFKFTWVIKNFSLCAEEGDEGLISPSFPEKTDNGMKWYLTLWPPSKFSGHSYYRIFVNLLNSIKNESVRASFKISMLEKCLKPVGTKQSNSFTFAPETTNRSGYSFAHEYVFDPPNGVLPHDTLTIFCEITVATNVVSKSDKLIMPKSICTLRTDFCALLANEKLSDVTLYATDGREVKAHKVILSARSAVFEAMFTYQTEENRNNRVKITDIDYEVLKEMLRYIYTGETPNLNEMATELLFAADKYALEPLKCMCLTVLYENLSINNVAEVFQVAHIHGPELLKSQAKDFLVAHASKVIKTDGWKSMARTHPDLVMEAFSPLAVLEP